MNPVKELQSIVQDLEAILLDDNQALVLSYHKEPSPFEMDFVYNPTRVTQSGSELPSDSDGVEDSILDSGGDRGVRPDNVRCNLCEDRVFPVRKYKNTGRLPVLVVFYNGALEGQEMNRDRSAKHLFGSEQEDDLFFRMVEASGFSPQDFSFQQYPACFFNPAESFPEDWNRRCSNCMNLLQNTIQEQKIQYLIAVGVAAVFLFGEQNARDWSESGELIDLSPQGLPVQAVAMRSPLALLTLESRRKQMKGTMEIKSQEKYEKLLSSEKRIKKQLLSTLKNIRQNF